MLLEASNIVKVFPVKTGWFDKRKLFVHAVDGVTLNLQEEETLALVGESGSGKTTLGKVILRLIEPTSGSIRFMDKDLLSLNREEIRQMRRHMQIISQDPYASLNPRKTIGRTLRQPFEIHDTHEKGEIQASVLDLLEKVGLTPPQHYVDKHPHELSGGQRQRIAIARAIALNPKLIVADEPVSSLDMSVRAQILNLMKGLQKKLRLTYLFITHDLSVVRSIASRVAVMYLGKIVEFGPVGQVFEHPQHPYTMSLLAATPLPRPRLMRSRQRMVIKGDIPSPIYPPSGCRFRTRCPYAEPLCSEKEPELRMVEKDLVSCHLAPII